jgi:hypothetical protein
MISVPAKTRCERLISLRGSDIVKALCKSIRRERNVPAAYFRVIFFGFRAELRMLGSLLFWLFRLNKLQRPVSHRVFVHVHAKQRLPDSHPCERIMERGN